MNTSPKLFSAWCILLALIPAGAHCQTARPAAPSAWRDGLKLLDSSSPADIVAAEHMLEQSVAQSPVPPEALCTLALVQLRRNDANDALTTLARLATKYESAQLRRTAALALRIKLYAALAAGDGSQADSAFKDLVRQIVFQSSETDELRFSAITIGVVVAMLEAKLAESPIAARDLEIGRNSMLRSNVPGVSTAFTSAYGQASERAAELVRQFESIAEKGIDVIAAEHAERLEALNLSLAELAEQKELAAEIFRNAREQTDQNKRDRRTIDKRINSINAQLRRATPGHPGPQRPAPVPPPPPTGIFINEFEIRTEYEYQNQDGQLVGIPVTREYRRSQADIDYERNAKYQRILDDYQRVKADYERYVDSYNEAVKIWFEADRARREGLNADMAAAQAQRADLLAETERIKTERSTVAKEILTTRTAGQQEEFELELQAIALEAARSQNIASAFRPANFPVLTWSQEKALLLRATQ